MIGLVHGYVLLHSFIYIYSSKSNTSLYKFLHMIQSTYRTLPCTPPQFLKYQYKSGHFFTDIVNAETMDWQFQTESNNLQFSAEFVNSQTGLTHIIQGLHTVACDEYLVTVHKSIYYNEHVNIYISIYTLLYLLSIPGGVLSFTGLVHNL